MESAQISAGDTVFWIRDLNLTERDKQLLDGGEWLLDSHISAVSDLLRRQYPKQSGLQSSLLLASMLMWKSSSKDFVQIVNVSQNHWLCASTSLSSPGVCDIYDCMPPTNSITLMRQIAAMMKCQSPEIKIRFIDVQRQSGGSDCGLFAAAFAEALCRGEDPHLMSFSQHHMREHLQGCSEKGYLSAFPAADKPRRLNRS